MHFTFIHFRGRITEAPFLRISIRANSSQSVTYFASTSWLPSQLSWCTSGRKPRCSGGWCEWHSGFRCFAQCASSVNIFTYSYYIFPTPLLIPSCLLGPAHLIQLGLKVGVKESLGKRVICLVGVYSDISSCCFCPHHKGCRSFVCTWFHCKELVF